MNRGRQTHDGCVHAARRQFQRGGFRRAGIEFGNRRRRIVFRRRAPLRDGRHAGCHQQRLARALEHRSDRLDRAPVRRAILREFREVVDERDVDDGIALGRAALERRQVLERTHQNLAACRGKRLRVGIGAHEAKHLVARRTQLVHHDRTDEPGGTCNKHTHGQTPLVDVSVLRSGAQPPA